MCVCVHMYVCLYVCRGISVGPASGVLFIASFRLGNHKHTQTVLRWEEDADEHCLAAAVVALEQQFEAAQCSDPSLEEDLLSLVCRKWVADVDRPVVLQASLQLLQRIPWSPWWDQRILCQKEGTAETLEALVQSCLHPSSYVRDP